MYLILKPIYSARFGKKATDLNKFWGEAHWCRIDRRPGRTALETTMIRDGGNPVPAGGPWRRPGAWAGGRPYLDIAKPPGWPPVGQPRGRGI